MATSRVIAETAQRTAAPGLIAIPAYNESGLIGALLDRLRACDPTESIVVIDDGSTDATAAEAAARGVEVVQHARNLGYHAALSTALSLAARRGDPYVVFLDGDGQHDPRDLEALRARAGGDDRPDLVVGSRFVEATGYRASFARRCGMLLFEVATMLAGAHVRDTTSGYKLIGSRLLLRLVDGPFNDLHSELIIFAVRRGFRVVEVPVHVAPGPGTSMYAWTDAFMYPLRTLAATIRLLRWDARSRATRRP